MKIGIYGGTFDPPHIGHINACKSFLEKIDMDVLYVIPTFLPPHKEIASDVSAVDRLEMCKIAFSSLSKKVTVSDIELARQGRSYTADTIKHFKCLYENNEIFFLCGTDMLLTLDMWYNPKYIFDNATIVHVRRADDQDILISRKIEEYQNKFDAKIIDLQSNIIEISSTEIRNTVRKCHETVELLSEQVYQYIINRGLYI
jgi:nicotinate-nucleotide adenylyltransferase